MTDKKFLSEFREFVSSQQAPPATCFPKVSAIVRRDLNPAFSLVLAKFAGVHAAAAVPVLAVCPQLGIGPFLLSGHGILHPFMAFGPTVCAVLCGVIFLGLTGIFATLCLRPEELRAARRFEWANLSAVSAFTLIALMLAGGEGAPLPYLGWLIGAVVGGWASLELGARWRLRAHPQ